MQMPVGLFRFAFKLTLTDYVVPENIICSTFFYDHLSRRYNLQDKNISYPKV
jgi:hypothetical protein